MVAPYGTVFANRHRYDVMQPVSRIEFRMDADHDADDPIFVVVTLGAEGSGCRITQVMTLPTVARRVESVGFGAEELGLQTLAKLAKLAAMAKARPWPDLGPPPADGVKRGLQRRQ